MFPKETIKPVKQFKFLGSITYDKVPRSRVQLGKKQIKESSSLLYVHFGMEDSWKKKKTRGKV